MASTRRCYSWFHRLLGIAAFCHALAVVQCALAVDLDAEGPAADLTPQLRLEAGGPTAYVTSLAFNPAADVLYSAGWNKVVETWLPDARQAGRWRRDAAGAFRVPIGPGLYGAINALAVSPDGGQLAVGGRGLFRGAIDAGQHGWVVPSAGVFTDEMLLDSGTIYLFDTRTHAVRPLRGHRGPVLALTYAVGKPGGDACLVSAASEPTEQPGVRQLIVRVWNLRTGAQLGSTALAYAQQARPALAAWRFGAAESQVAVFIAAGQADQRLRLWNVETGKSFAANDGPANNTLALLPGAARLVTGSGRQLRLWNVPPAADRPPTIAQGLALAETPQAVALFASRPNGPVDRAVIVLGAAGVGGVDRLQVVQLAPLAVAGGATPLWQGFKAPSIAATRLGGQIAVAGNAQHEIKLYDSPRLAAGSAAARQTLRGEGVRFASASFVRKGAEYGLWLTAPPATGTAARSEGKWLFDPARGELVASGKGWSISAPSAAGWRFEPGKANQGPRNGRAFLRVRQGQRIDFTVWLEANVELSTYAVAPATADRPPVLAVASHWLGQPLLQLFNAQTGERFRQLVGHVERISGLAFDGDGKFLVSTAQDQMTCVWSLDDLDDTLRTHGALPWLIVERRDGRLAVAKIDDQTAPRSLDLKPGDIVSGLVESDELTKLADAAEFHAALLLHEPGETITMRRQRADGVAVDVRLTVGQATDERLPLFSFYAIERRPGGPVDWLGWAPWGAYEGSGPEIERRIGWHFNTGQPDEPVRFALAPQYAKLRRVGLLATLLSAPGEPVEPIVPPAPQLNLWLQPAEKAEQRADSAFQPVGDGETVRLTSPGATLRLDLSGEFDSELIDSVRYTIAADEAAEAADEPREGAMLPVESSSREWLAKLGDLYCRRGRQRVRVSVHTNEERPREFARNIVIDYRPRPLIELVLPEPATLDAAEKQMTFQARIAPADSRHAELNISLAHSVDGRHLKTWQFNDLDVRQRLTLEPGENVLRLTAVSADAPTDAATGDTATDEMAADEMATVSRTIYYRQQAPKLQFVALAADGAEQPLSSDQAEKWVVRSPRLVLRGKIVSREMLSSAGWTNAAEEGEPSDRRSFAGFVPGQTTELEVDEAVSLTPGLQTLECRAEVAGGPASAARLTIEYRPGLPQVWFTSPAPGTRLVEGPEPAPLVLRLAWSLPDDPEAFDAGVVRKAEVLLDGAAVDAKLQTIDEVKRTFSLLVPPLAESSNRFRVRLVSDWDTASTDELPIEFARPPRIVSVDAPADVDASLAGATLLIESPNELELTALEVNQLAWPLVAKMESAGPLKTRWQVEVGDIPLGHQGSNQISLVVANRDGKSLPHTLAIRRRAPRPPPKPRVEIESPAEGPQPRPNFDAVFSVVSTTRLRSVALVANGARQELDVSRQIEVSDKRFEMHERVPVKLKGGNWSSIEVIAVNEGGVSRAARTVSSPPPPVEIILDQLDTLSAAEVARPNEQSKQQAAALKPRPTVGGGYRFDQPSPRGEVWLHGRVRWTNAGDPGLKKPALVEVAVNGFSQLPVRLSAAAAGSLERKWEAKLCLNRADANQVTIDVPRLALDAGNRLTFAVDCANPDRLQRLHLLVVKIGDTDTRELEDAALRAVGGVRDNGPADGDSNSGDSKNGDRHHGRSLSFHTPVFQQGRVYRPKRMVFDPQTLAGAIHQVLTQIRYKPPQYAGGSDLFMLYYRGADAVDRRGDFYLLTSAGDPVESGLSDAELAGLFREVPGAQLFLLDVERSAARGEPLGDVRPTWGRGRPRPGMLRYAWRSAGERPENAYVLLAFQRAAATHATLEEIRVEIGKVYQGLKQRFGDDLRLEAQVPEGLRGLVLGRAPGAAVP
jgi:WD40 repeat protein